MLTDATPRGMNPRSKLYRRANARGLCIEVRPSGSRLWRLRYRHGGKQKMLNLENTSQSKAERRESILRKLLREDQD